MIELYQSLRTRNCRNRPSRRRNLGAGWVLCSILVTGCGGGNDNTDFTAADIGAIQVLNAVSDAPPLTFLIEDTTFATLSFGQASAFSSLDDGSFEIRTLFTDLEQDTIELFDENVRVEDGEQTTVVLAGTVAAPVEIIISALNPDVATAATELLVLNTAGAGTLDVFVTEPDAELANPLANVANNAVSDVLATTPGTRRLRVTAAGSSTVLYDSGNFELGGGGRALVHVKPYFGPGGAGVTAALVIGGSTTGFGNQTLPSTVRIANAIADEPAADAVLTGIDTSATLSAIPANSFSATNAFAPGMIDLSVNLQTDPGTQFFADTANLNGGEQRTLLVAGLFGNDTTIGRLALDPIRPLATAAQLNVLNGSISADDIDIYLLAPNETVTGTVPVIADLAVLANSNIQILPGTFDLLITETGQSATLAGPISVTFSTALIYTLLITDADGGGTPPRFILGDAFIE